MTETTMHYPQGATPEDIWILLREAAAIQKETKLQMQETDRQMQETDRRMQETDRQMQETARQIKETDKQIKETDKQMKETDKKIGALYNRFGELAEHLVIPNIKEKFKPLGFNFEEVSQNKQISNAAGNHITEIDILLENGDTVIAVEVKAKPNQKDVQEHIKRMDVLRRRADDRQDKRKFQGAIAGAIMSDAVRNNILKNGFYVIEQTGDTVKINIPEGFKPRQW